MWVNCELERFNLGQLLIKTAKVMSPPIFGTKYHMLMVNLQMNRGI